MPLPPGLLFPSFLCASSFSLYWSRRPAKNQLLHNHDGMSHLPKHNPTTEAQYVIYSYSYFADGWTPT